MPTHMCYVFSVIATKRWIKAGQNTTHWGTLLKNASSSSCFFFMAIARTQANVFLKDWGVVLLFLILFVSQIYSTHFCRLIGHGHFDLFSFKFCRFVCGIIKWSGISPYFARLWLAETAFTRVYLRLSTQQTVFSGVFGVSIFSHARLTAAGGKNGGKTQKCCQLKAQASRCCDLLGTWF